MSSARRSRTHPATGSLLEALTGSPASTLPTLLRARAAATPDAVFLHWQGASWSYSDALREAERFAGFLREIGVASQRQRVASYLGNCPEALWTWFGTLLAGCVYVPLNRTHRGSAARGHAHTRGCHGARDRRGGRRGGRRLRRTSRARARSGGRLAVPDPPRRRHRVLERRRRRAVGRGGPVPVRPRNGHVHVGIDGTIEGGHDQSAPAAAERVADRGGLRARAPGCLARLDARVPRDGTGLRGDRIDRGGMLDRTPAALLSFAVLAAGR